MDVIKTLTDFAAKVPLDAVQRERIELIKQQVETTEARLKLAEDARRFADERSDRMEKENAELRAEVVDMAERLAALHLSEEFEMSGPFVVKKGSDQKLCPICKLPLSQDGRFHSCPKCHWHHTVPAKFRVYTARTPW